MDVGGVDLTGVHWSAGEAGTGLLEVQCVCGGVGERGTEPHEGRSAIVK